MSGHDATVEDPAGSNAFAHDLAELIAGMRADDTRGRRFDGVVRGGHLPDHDEWLGTCRLHCLRYLTSLPVVPTADAFAEHAHVGAETVPDGDGALDATGSGTSGTCGRSQLASDGTVRGVLRDWWRRRRTRRAKERAVRQRLQEEYLHKLESKDPDALESSRDFGDNDLTPRRVELSMALVFVGFLALLGIVVVLIAFFLAIQHFTGG